MVQSNALLGVEHANKTPRYQLTAERCGFGGESLFYFVAISFGFSWITTLMRLMRRSSMAITSKV